MKVLIASLLVLLNALGGLYAQNFPPTTTRFNTPIPGSEAYSLFDIESNNDSTLISVWSHSNNPECFVTNRLYFSRSTDSGRTWCSAKDLLEDGSLDCVQTNDISILHLGDNKWVVIFSEYKFGEFLSLKSALSVDNGLTWTLGPSRLLGEGNKLVFSRLFFEAIDKNTVLVLYGTYLYRDSGGLSESSIYSTTLALDSAAWGNIQEIVKLQTDPIVQVIEPGGLVKLRNSTWMATTSTLYPGFPISPKTESYTSIDGGQTWADPKLIYDGLGEGDWLRFTSSDNLDNVLLVFTSRANYSGMNPKSDDETWYVFSADRGTNWSAPSIIAPELSLNSCKTVRVLDVVYDPYYSAWFSPGYLTGCFLGEEEVNNALYLLQFTSSGDQYLNKIKPLSPLEYGAGRDTGERITSNGRGDIYVGWRQRFEDYNTLDLPITTSIHSPPPLPDSLLLKLD